jgi:hypothetical protein
MQLARPTCHDGPEHAVQSGPLHGASLILLLLLAADTAFVIVHLVHKHSSLLASELYSLSKDGGYAEIFQYVKTYWIVIMLFALWWRTRERVYAAWMLLFAYLLCDDALQIHERGGGVVARTLSYADWLGLWAKNWGELTVSGVAGLAFLALLSTTYLRSTREARNVSKDLALLLAVLVFFGVFVDALHALVLIPYLKPALGVVEDAGEMLAMSVACWYVLTLLERRADAPAWLWHSALGMLSAKRLRAG